MTSKWRIVPAHPSTEMRRAAAKMLGVIFRAVEPPYRQESWDFADEILRVAYEAAPEPDDEVVERATMDLLDVCDKQLAWLDMLTQRADAGAKDRRFITLAEAHAADAKNFRATAAPLMKAVDALRQALGESRG